MSAEIKYVSIVANKEKDAGYKITKEIIEYLVSVGVVPVLDNEYIEHTGKDKVVPMNKENINRSSFVIVIGGDGTILKALSILGEYKIPMFGINLGKVGFLASVECENWKKYLDKALNGDYKIDERIMLDVKDINNKILGYALNDAVFFRKNFDGVVEYQVYIDDEFVAHYHADGVIVAAPTGSTAYNLSSGGPIVNPNTDLLILTPISAHSLNNKSIIVNSKEVVKVKLNIDKSALFIDGREMDTGGDEVFVEKSERKAYFIRFNDYNFYSLLAKKIKLPSYVRGGLS